MPSASDISNRDSTRSFDFAIYDDRVVTEVFSHPGKYFARKTTQPMEVSKYLHLYDLIEHSSHAVTLDGDRIILAGDAMPIAA
jgi:deoxyadenosine/deoxycytidine kinase